MVFCLVNILFHVFVVAGWGWVAGNQPFSQGLIDLSITCSSLANVCMSFESRYVCFSWHTRFVETMIWEGEMVKEKSAICLRNCWILSLTCRVNLPGLIMGRSNQYVRDESMAWMFHALSAIGLMVATTIKINLRPMRLFVPLWRKRSRIFSLLGVFDDGGLEWKFLSVFEIWSWQGENTLSKIENKWRRQKRTSTFLS